MGVTRWLDLIHPDAWEAATLRIHREGADLLDPAAATDFLAGFGKEPSAEWLTVLDDAEAAGEWGDEEFVALALNELLERAVTEREWDLGGSASSLEAVVKALPGASPLRRVVEFGGLDVPPPERCRVDDSGLLGCCSVKSLRDCLEVVERYPTPEAVQEALDESPAGLRARLSGRAGKVAAARAALCQAPVADAWRALVEAVDRSVRRGRLLGLGLST